MLTGLRITNVTEEAKLCLTYKEKQYDMVIIIYKHYPATLNLRVIKTF